MKRVLQLILVFFLSQAIWAQQSDEYLTKGQCVLEDLMNSRGEKVYDLLNGEMKAAITAPQLNSLWIGLTMQLGKCKEVTDWKEQVMNGSQVITSRLNFEKQPLLFVVSFYDGKINGLRVIPDMDVAKEKVQARKPVSNENFEEREINVVTGKFILPGYLTVPKSGSNFPCVVMVHGSGANDRNETIGENRPFEDLAHGLAEKGIASVRYDKRAFVYQTQAVPEGENLNLSNEVTEDVLSAVKLACEQKEIDPSRIFVLGHSLGGMLAPRIASLCPELKGIIMMAGNARPFDELITEQILYLNSLNPTPGAEEEAAQVKKEFENLRKMGTPQYDPAIKSPMGQPASYWQDFDNYRQTEVAKTLTLPVFILNGERDYNVTMVDFNIWQKVLKGKKNISFKSYPVLNHLFMESSVKPTPKDYETPRHIPGYVIDDLAKWIQKQK